MHKNVILSITVSCKALKAEFGFALGRFFSCDSSILMGSLLCIRSLNNRFKSVLLGVFMRNWQRVFCLSIWISLDYLFTCWFIMRCKFVFLYRHYRKFKASIREGILLDIQFYSESNSYLTLLAPLSPTCRTKTICKRYQEISAKSTPTKNWRHSTDFATHKISPAVLKYLSEQRWK